MRWSGTGLVSTCPISSPKECNLGATMRYATGYLGHGACASAWNIPSLVPQVDKGCTRGFLLTPTTRPDSSFIQRTVLHHAHHPHWYRPHCPWLDPPLLLRYSCYALPPLLLLRPNEPNRKQVILQSYASYDLLLHQRCLAFQYTHPLPPLLID